jgi:uncharacterized protein
MTNSQPTTSRLTQTSFHLLAKPTGAICNLDCTYCFFLSKDALYPGESMRMSSETLETYLRQLFESQPDGPVSVAWQGGEPTLMGLDFYQRVIDLIHQLVGWKPKRDLSTIIADISAEMKKTS